MRLTNPSALWFLILLAIPLLLARRPTPRSRQVVSNLYLWQDLVRRDPDRLAMRRLRRNWLVALQIALMAAAIVALAGPVVAFRAARVAFVFDVSMSMGARDGTTTRLGVARERARALLRRLPQDAVVRLIAAGTSPRDLGDHPAGDSGMDAILEAVTPTAGSADVPAAIRLAAVGDTNAQPIFVFSDRSERDVAGLVGSASAAVRWEHVGHATGNVALARIAARRHPVKAAEGQVLVEVRNYGTQARDAEVEIAQDGTVIGRQSVPLPARGTQTIVQDIPRLGRLLSARLREDDALDLDNQRLAVIPVLDRVHVRLITPGSFFLEKVLAANPRITLESGPPGGAPNLAEVAARNANSRVSDVVVCDGCVEPPGQDEATLIIAPRAGSLGPAPLTIARPDHLLTASLQFGELFVTPLGSAGVAARGDVILRAGGLPVAVAYERDGRRILELRLDVAAPELALSIGFPILVANAIDWLAARDENGPEVSSGEPLRWRLPALFQPDRVSVTGPDNRLTRRQLQGRYLTTADTGVPGLYHVRTPVGEQVFVVNPAVDSESDLMEVDAESSSGGRPDVAQPVDDERHVAPVLLLLAFGLLAAEWQYRWKRDGPAS